MALQCNFKMTIPELNVPVSIENAYCKVEFVGGGKEKICATISVSVDDDRKGSFGYEFTPSVADGSENFIKQTYEYLKTLPEFADATDV